MAERTEDQGLIHPAARNRSSLLCGSFLLLLSGLYVFLFIQYLPVGPAPTDDLFYVDAAHKLYSGTYTAPTKNFPYHHYLRWPVNLVIVGLFWLFGACEKTVGAYTLVHWLAISFLTYFVVFRLYGRHVYAAAASLAPLLMPASMQTFLVRSEPAAITWTLASFAFLVVRRPGWPRVRLLASGAAMALAVNATQVTAFSVPIVLVLIRHLHVKDANRRTLLRKMAIFLVGLWAAYEMIMILEWIFLGDYLIQYKSITWWHMRPTEDAPTLAAFFDPDNRLHFVLGLLLNLIRQQPLFIAVVVLVLLGDRARLGRLTTPSTLLLTMCLVSILCIEVFGAPVIRKVYVRFLAIPVYLLCVYLLIHLVALVRFDVFRADTVGLKVVLLLVFGIYAIRNCSANLTVDRWVPYYRNPIRIIMADVVAHGASPRDTDILFEDEGIHGLIQWDWAVRCYSDYTLAAADVFTKAKPSRRRTDQLTYFVATTDTPVDMARWGFTRLDDAKPPARPCPKVYVYRPSRRGQDPPAAVRTRWSRHKSPCLAELTPACDGSSLPWQEQRGRSADRMATANLRETLPRTSGGGGGPNTRHLPQPKEQ